MVLVGVYNILNYCRQWFESCDLPRNVFLNVKFQVICFCKPYIFNILYKYNYV